MSPEFESQMETCPQCESSLDLICPRCMRSFCSVDHAIEHMDVLKCSGIVDLTQFLYTNESGNEVVAQDNSEYNLLCANNAVLQELEHQEEKAEPSRNRLGRQENDIESDVDDSISSTSDASTIDLPFYSMKVEQHVNDRQAELDYEKHVHRFSVSLYGLSEGYRPQYFPSLDSALYHIKIIDGTGEHWVESPDSATLESVHDRSLDIRFREVLRSLDPHTLSAKVAMTVLATYKSDALKLQVPAPALHDVAKKGDMHFYLLPTMGGPFSRKLVHHVDKTNSVREAVMGRFINGNPTFLVSQHGPNEPESQAQYVIDQSKTALPEHMRNAVKRRTVDGILALVDLAIGLKNWITGVEGVLVTHDTTRGYSERCRAVGRMLIQIKQRSGLEWDRVKEEMFLDDWMAGFWRTVKEGAKDRVWRGSRLRRHHRELVRNVTAVLQREGDIKHSRMVPPPRDAQDYPVPSSLQLAMSRMRQAWKEAR